MKNNKNKGFTLIELLVVISIIGMLASVILASMSGVRSKARDSARIQGLVQMRTALELYRSTNGSYPNTNGVATILTAGSAPTTLSGLSTYISKVPGVSGETMTYYSDGNDYIYYANTFENTVTNSALRYSGSVVSGDASKVAMISTPNGLAKAGSTWAVTGGSGGGSAPTVSLSITGPYVTSCGPNCYAYGKSNAATLTWTLSQSSNCSISVTPTGESFADELVSTLSAVQQPLTTGGSASVSASISHDSNPTITFNCGGTVSSVIIQYAW